MTPYLNAAWWDRRGPRPTPGCRGRAGSLRGAPGRPAVRYVPDLVDFGFDLGVHVEHSVDGAHVADQFPQVRNGELHNGYVAVRSVQSAPAPELVILPPAGCVAWLSMPPLILPPVPDDVIPGKLPEFAQDALVDRRIAVLVHIYEAGSEFALDPR